MIDLGDHHLPDPGGHAHTLMGFEAHREVEESLELMEPCFPSCSIQSECGGNFGSAEVEDGSPPRSQRAIPRGELFYNQAHHLGFI